jgi:hypothetical protein
MRLKWSRLTWASTQTSPSALPAAVRLGHAAAVEQAGQRVVLGLVEQGPRAVGHPALQVGVGLHRLVERADSATTSASFSRSSATIWRSTW